MNKLPIVLAILLLVPSVLAISTDLKEIYQPGETLIAEISGNILEPISREDVELKRNNVQVPWEYDVKRVGDRYFVWGIVPDEENNYTLHIRDITTTVNGIIKIIDFNQTFETSGEFISYSLKPGFAIFQDEIEFTIFLNRDFNEPIIISFPQEHEFILKPGENRLTIESSGAEQGFQVIQIGIYSAPILILEQEEEAVNLPSLRFFPKNIESTILIGESAHYPFSIINTGEFELTDLELEFNPEIFIIEPAMIELIGPEKRLDFNLSLKNRNEPIDETIFLRSGDLSLEFPILITYTENEQEVGTPYLEEDFTEEQAYYCVELEGQACASNEICSGQTFTSLDFPSCCIGTCTAPEETSFAWVGYLIGIAILIILIIVVLKYRKSKKNNPDVLKEKISEAEKPKRSLLFWKK